MVYALHVCVNIFPVFVFLHNILLSSVIGGKWKAVDHDALVSLVALMLLH